MPSRQRSSLLTAHPCRDEHEKITSFTGLCFMLKADTSVFVRDFAHVVAALASWSSPPPEPLLSMHRQVLVAFKSQAGGGMWGEMVTSLSDRVPVELHRLYGI